MRSLLLILLPLFVSAATLDSIILKEVKSAGYAPQNIGFAITESSQDSLLGELNGTSQFIPASVQKLFTGAAAMSALSPLHDFRTEIYVDSLDRSTGSVVGNIYVKGHGDPGFTAEQLWLLAYHLRMEGITSISDSLIIDNSYFDTASIGPGFADPLSSRAYMAPVAPTSVNFNAIAVHVLPTVPGQQAEISYLPPQEEQRKTGRITTVSAGQSSGLKVSTFEDNSETVVSLNGTINSTDKSRTIYRKIWNPVQGFGRAFLASCEQVGIRCSVTVSAGVVPQKLNTPFYRFSSKPLQEHIRNMFKYSNNFIAEMIFRTINAETDSVPGAWNGGATNVLNWWKSIASDTSMVPTIVNGSGMGSSNRTSPMAVIQILDYALDQSRWSAEFISALPVAGEDGTLGKRFTKTPLKGVMRAKTGTLNSNGVSNLAGYIFKNGKTYPFVFFVNDSSKGQYSHWLLHEKVLNALYKEL